MTKPWFPHLKRLYEPRNPVQRHSPECPGERISHSEGRRSTKVKGRAPSKIPTQASDQWAPAALLPNFVRVFELALIAARLYRLQLPMCDRRSQSSAEMEALRSPPIRRTVRRNRAD